MDINVNPERSESTHFAFLHLLSSSYITTLAPFTTIAARKSIYIYTLVKMQFTIALLALLPAVLAAPAAAAE